MSAWKLAARELYAASRPLRSGEMMTTDAIGLRDARRMGLAERQEHNSAGEAVWQLTQRGRDWCEGRTQLNYKRPGGYCWAATWLRALPVGLRLAA